MRSKLSYYSVALLVGLAVVSVLVLAMNPFNSQPTGATALTQGSSSASANNPSSGGSPLISNSTSPLAPGNGLGRGAQQGGFDGDHDGNGGHDGGYFGSGGFSGGGSVTTTTSSIYSQNE